MIYGIDGPNGSGKTTLINKILEADKNNRFVVFSVKNFPDSEPEAVQVLKDRVNFNVDNHTKIKLVLSHQRLMEYCQRYLEQYPHKTILLDRTIASFYTYQCYCDDDTEAFILFHQELKNYEFKMHYVYLKPTFEETIIRTRSRGDADHLINIDKLMDMNKAYNGYLSYANQYSDSKMSVIIDDETERLFLNRLYNEHADPI